MREANIPACCHILTRQSPIAERFTGTNRFGRSSDFTSLFGTEEEQSDYIEGLVFSAILLAIFYIIWFLAICCFRCLGPYRVGFLSGGAFRSVVDSEEVLGPQEESEDGSTKKRKNDDDALKYYHEGFSLYNRASRVRLCFLLSGLIFIVFSVREMHVDCEGFIYFSLRTVSLDHRFWQ